MKNKTRRLVFLAMSLAVAMVLSYIEAMFPINIGVPGVKLGLPNIVILIILIKYDWKSALSVMLLRILFVSITFGSLSMMLYSLAGGVCSFLIMIILLQFYPKTVSLTSISVAGGVFHNLGQILMAMVVLGTSSLIYYMLLLVVAGSVSGFATGVAATYSLKALRKV